MGEISAQLNRKDSIWTYKTRRELGLLHQQCYNAALELWKSINDLSILLYIDNEKRMIPLQSPKYKYNAKEMDEIYNKINILTIRILPYINDPIFQYNCIDILIFLIQVYEINSTWTLFWQILYPWREIILKYKMIQKSISRKLIEDNINKFNFKIFNTAVYKILSEQKDSGYIYSKIFYTITQLIKIEEINSLFWMMSKILLQVDSDYSDPTLASIIIYLNSNIVITQSFVEKLFISCLKEKKRKSMISCIQIIVYNSYIINKNIIANLSYNDILENPDLIIDEELVDNFLIIIWESLKQYLANEKENEDVKDKESDKNSITVTDKLILHITEIFNKLILNFRSMNLLYHIFIDDSLQIIELKNLVRNARLI